MQELSKKELNFLKHLNNLWQKKNILSLIGEEYVIIATLSKGQGIQQWTK